MTRGRQLEEMALGRMVRALRLHNNLLAATALPDSGGIFRSNNAMEGGQV
jgi:hypothetical protein